jgi:Aminoglycoside-2''-adenylyltransferase
MDAMESSWNPLTVDQVAEQFSGRGVDWWIAGGLAIDLFLGWETRRHEDIDVEMFRSDRDALFDVFDGWDLHMVSEGSLRPWRPGEDLDPPVFGIWGRPSPSAPWAVEVILADGDSETWRFRREPSITMPRRDLVRHTHAGVPFCTPEVQLLYKAKRARPKDDADLARCLHRLDQPQKLWLLGALRRFTTGSDTATAWVEVLDQATRLSARAG